MFRELMDYKSTDVPFGDDNKGPQINIPEKGGATGEKELLSGVYFAN